MAKIIRRAIPIGAIDEFITPPPPPPPPPYVTLMSWPQLFQRCMALSTEYIRHVTIKQYKFGSVKTYASMAFFNGKGSVEVRRSKCHGCLIQFANRGVKHHVYVILYHVTKFPLYTVVYSSLFLHLN